MMHPTPAALPAAQLQLSGHATHLLQLLLYPLLQDDDTEHREQCGRLVGGSLRQARLPTKPPMAPAEAAMD